MNRDIDKLNKALMVGTKFLYHILNPTGILKWWTAKANRNL